MSTFKSNNRFVFLDDNENNSEHTKQNISFKEKETRQEQQHNNNSYNNNSYNKFKLYTTTNTSVSKPQKKEFEIKDDEFPDLLSLPLKNKSNNAKSFSSLLKEKIIKESKEEDPIPPGWSFYKCTKIDNGIFGNNYSKIQEPLIIQNNKSIKQNIKPKLNEAEKIIIALSVLHEKRTNEYKELWGEDEWEKMFICPNHDYEYFDKLDEAYEIEEANYDEKYSINSEYEYEYD